MGTTQRPHARSIHARVAAAAAATAAADLVGGAETGVDAVDHQAGLRLRQHPRVRDEAHLAHAVAGIRPASLGVHACLDVAHKVLHQLRERREVKVVRGEGILDLLRAAQPPGRARHVDDPRRRLGLRSRGSMASVTATVP